MTKPARARYAGYRFPEKNIGHACGCISACHSVYAWWSHRGIIVSQEIGLQWARKFGQEFANQIRRRLPWVSDKWHLGKVAPRSRV
jgi:putative transposase